jgi:hypothetical protein
MVFEMSRVRLISMDCLVEIPLDSQIASSQQPGAKYIWLSKTPKMGAAKSSHLSATSCDDVAPHRSGF